jgi:hypothetical protein
MALTAEETLSIAMILGIPPSVLDAQIASLGSSLDADREAAIRTELDRWSAGSGAQFVKIHPKESNYGVETNSGDAKQDIQRNLAVLLELTTWLGTSTNMGTLQIGA